MTKIIGTDRSSICMYCNQQTYGRGCPYSPHRTHVHIDDPGRCIFCGFTGFGHGCPYNPFGRNHIHGVEFNMAKRESTQRTILSQLFIERLMQPFDQTHAYKLKLIDISGRRIRQPETIEEKVALTPLDIYIFKLKRLLGSQIQLLNSSVVLESLSRQPIVKDVEINKKEVELRERIVQLVEDCRRIMHDGTQNGFSLDQIENIVVETVCDEGN